MLGCTTARRILISDMSESSIFCCATLSALTALTAAHVPVLTFLALYTARFALEKLIQAAVERLNAIVKSAVRIPVPVCRPSNYHHAAVHDNRSIARALCGSFSAARHGSSRQQCCEYARRRPCRRQPRVQAEETFMMTGQTVSKTHKQAHAWRCGCQLQSL
jgi:hypothetical protein